MSRGVDHGHIAVIVEPAALGVGEEGFLEPGLILEEDHGLEVHEAVLAVAAAVLGAVVADHPGCPGPPCC